MSRIFASPIAGALSAMILVAIVVAATTNRFLDPGQSLQPRAAGLASSSIVAIGSTLRDPDRRHRSFARLGDRADDDGLRDARQDLRLGRCRSPVIAVLVLGARARADQRRADRLSAHPLLHHDARDALRLPRRRLHVQQRLADLLRVAEYRRALLRHARGRSAAALLCRRALCAGLLVPALHARSGGRSTRSEATPARRGFPASTSAHAASRLRARRARGRRRRRADDGAAQFRLAQLRRRAGAFRDSGGGDRRRQPCRRTRPCRQHRHRRA